MFIDYIFEKNVEPRHFENKIIAANNKYFKNTDRPYRAWLFRESNRVEGAIVLMTQVEANKFDNYIFCYQSKEPGKSEESLESEEPGKSEESLESEEPGKWNSNPYPSYMKIYRSSPSTNDFDIDEIIANLCEAVCNMKPAFFSKYMIKPGTPYEPMLVKEEFQKTTELSTPSMR